MYVFMRKINHNDFLCRKKFKHEERNVEEEKKYLVCERELLELLRVCALCGGFAQEEIVMEAGTFIRFKRV